MKKRWTKRTFVAHLRNRVVPELRANDASGATADDLAEVAHSIANKTPHGWVSKFIDHLEGTRIPELVAFGRTELAAVFETGISFLRARRGALLKLRDVQKHLSNIGIVLKKQDGEYRVSFRVDHRCTRERAESTAYYTDLLEDALETGLRMARDGG